MSVGDSQGFEGDENQFAGTPPAPLANSKQAKTPLISGRIIHVDELATTVRVKIVDESTDTLATIEFQDQLGLGVFRSMERIGQRLVVRDTQEVSSYTNGAKFASLRSVVKKGNDYEIETASQDSTRYLLRADNANFESVLKKLYHALNSNRQLWFAAAHGIESKRSTPGTEGNIVRHVELIDVFDIGDIFEVGWPRPATSISPFQNLKHEPMHVSRAKDLLDQILLLSTNTESDPTFGIPFAYIQDGCAARCHTMTRFLLQQSVSPIKIWVQAINGQSFNFSGPNSPEIQTTWGWHTAPAISTYRGLYVVDPSVSTNLLPVSQWCNEFSRPWNRRVYTCSYPVYALNPNGTVNYVDPHFTRSELELEQMRNLLWLDPGNHSPFTTTRSFKFIKKEKLHDPK